MVNGRAQEGRDQSQEEHVRLAHPQESQHPQVPKQGRDSFEDREQPSQPEQVPGPGGEQEESGGRCAGGDRLGGGGGRGDVGDAPKIFRNTVQSLQTTVPGGVLW